MSPRATCCFTISYSAVGQLAGLAQDRVGDADLADVVEEAGDLDRPDEVRIQVQPPGEEHAVAGDVLGVALRVAVLRVDREDEALEDVEAGRLRRRPPTPVAGDPDRVAARRLRLLEDPGDGREQDRRPTRRAPGRCRGRR